MLIKTYMSEIPQELQSLNQWVYWRDVNSVKVPFCSQTQAAKTNDSSTWLSWDCVIQYNKLGMSGIGFVLTAEDPYTFIDLDKCIDINILEDGFKDRTPNDFSMKVACFFKSYTEISPSGRGTHIVVKGQIPEPIKRPEIEIYSNKRYMCMTGEMVWNYPIRYCQKELNKVYKKYKPVQKKRFKPYTKKEGTARFYMPDTTIAEGDRNNQLAKWCGFIRHKVSDVNEYFDLVCQLNERCMSPPLPEHEVKSVARNIWRYQ